MKLRSFLFSAAAAETPEMGGNGSAAQTPAAAETPAASTPAAETPAANTPAAQVGRLERITSYLAGKAELIKERDEAKQSLQLVIAERDNLKQELAKTQQDLSDAKNELQSISAALSAAEQSQKTVNAAAAEIVASAGLPSASLPAAEEAPTDTIASLEKAYQAETNPKNKQKIAMKIKELQRENSK